MPLEATCLYTWNAPTKKWEFFAPGASLDATPALPADINLLTWHVSCTEPYPAARTLGIIRFIECLPTTPHLIFLQEVDNRSHNALLLSEYIRKTYNISPVGDATFVRSTASEWGFGNCVLVHKSLKHLNCLYMKFENTVMNYSCIVVDFKHATGNYARFIGTQLEYGATDAAAARRVAQIGELVALSNDPTLRSTVICGYMGQYTDSPNGFADVFVSVAGEPERGTNWNVTAGPPATGERRTKVFVKGSAGTTDPANMQRIAGCEKVTVQLANGTQEQLRLSESLGVTVKLRLG